MVISVVNGDSLLQTRQCVSVFEGHTSKVNCILLSSGPGLAPRLYSGSSDQTVRCYSLRVRVPIPVLQPRLRYLLIYETILYLLPLV